ncbi:MAG: hypothetical protein KatS3mg124_0165 [Porticoccaceae bacterium]|nr:MAG: hypothetical protein KatS3mg124_0165 [Porticoccaceae bacterium]
MNKTRAPGAKPHFARRKLAAVGLSGLALAALAVPEARAQTGERSLVLEEIVVTARRREERLQDVPISISVLDQQKIADLNIINAGDLATYVPSLSVNTRFGQDGTIFQIRGMTQELRTTASVGVYFAEVVAPRGANTSSSGDGAGPGDFFDLENVQVLKGPQGTLFGRNTTGGAILLTPKKPTDEFEGYVEASGGNYDLRRLQAVVNVPVSEQVRLRFGVDDQSREGYLDNVSGKGPDHFANVNYTAFRASAVVDITENLENYTIFKWLDSRNNATPGSLVACNPAPGTLFGPLCEADFANREALGKGLGFYDVWNEMSETYSEIDSWQVINHTTWEVNDALSVKNILSYAEFQMGSRYPIYGTNFFKTPVFGGDPLWIPFGLTNEERGRKTADSSTFVEELQFFGTAFDERLTWQVGLYYEKTEPEDDYGAASWNWLACDESTMSDPDPNNWRCNDVALLNGLIPAPFSGSQALAFGVPQLAGVYFGSKASAPGGVEYDNRAAFAQGTWRFSDQWAVTAGLRYTDDETKGYTDEVIARFPGNLLTGGYFPPDSVIVDSRRPKTKSDEWTWLVDLEYTPAAGQLYYLKYAKGYRQGSVNLAADPPFDVHEPEELDAYEAGAKLSFEGAMPATLNVAVFFNDLKDQQLQYGYLSGRRGVGTTAIVNAGSSEVWGLELDGTVLLTDQLSFTLAYSYLDTEVKDLVLPDLSAVAPRGVTPSTAEGEDLPLTPENQLLATLAWRLPVAESWGEMVAAVTYSYVDERQSASPSLTGSPYVILDDYDLVNLNFNWRGVLGSPFDFSAFVTNLTDEEYYTYVTGNWGTGFELAQLGQPRMWGARLRYNF